MGILVPAHKANARKVEPTHRRTPTNSHTHAGTDFSNSDKSATCRYVALRRFLQCRYGALTRSPHCTVTIFVDLVRAPTGHLHVFLRGPLGRQFVLIALVPYRGTRYSLIWSVPLRGTYTYSPVHFNVIC